MNPLKRTDWAELAALFDEVSELDARQRARRVGEVRGLDSSLAARLQALLVADAAASGLLERSLEEVAPGLHETLLATEWETCAGLVLGRYRLLEPIGSGGMGEVWRAERADGEYRQDVAVKLLKRGMDTQAILRRFLQERSILARLQHPGIVRLIDGGMSNDGRPYFVMEFVVGAAVTEYAATAHLDVRARVALVATIADAVSYAHAQLIVHRDLKPSNVIVDVKGTPHLLDFGIAKLLETSGEQTLTGTGVRVLSPAYAAPEQILGEAVGTATDVYALGVLLYELLTGELPHRRLSRDPGVLAAELGNESVEKPSQAIGQGDQTILLYGHTDAKRVSRELSGDLDLIVATATRTEPQRRYATMAAFADDLRRWLERRPINARADTAGYRLRKFVRRHRLGVAAAAMVSAAMIGGLGIALWQAGVARDEAARADAEAHRAELQARAARESANRSGRVKDFMMSIFMQEDPLRRTQQDSLTLAQAFTNTLRRIDGELVDDPELQGDLLDDFGEIEAGRGKFDAAKVLFERALALAEKVHGPEHPAVAESLLNLGVVAAYRGATMEGKDALERAVGILEKFPEEEDRLVAALGGYGNVLQASGRSEEAVAVTARALGIYRRTRTLDDGGLAIALSNHAVALSDIRRFDEAEPLLRESIAINEKLQGPMSPGLFPTLSLLVETLLRQGRHTEQLATAERALSIARAAYPQDHPWVAGAFDNLAGALAELDQPARAETFLHDSIAMYDRLGSPRVAEPLGTLAVIQVQRGDLVEGRATYARAVAACRTGGMFGGKMCQTLFALQAAADAVERPDSALADIDAAEREIIGIAGERSDEHSKVLRARSLALAALGRYGEAIEVQRRLVALNETLYGASHRITERSRQALAELKVQVDEKPRAGGTVPPVT